MKKTFIKLFTCLKQGGNYEEGFNLNSKLPIDKIETKGLYFSYVLDLVKQARKGFRTQSAS